MVVAAENGEMDQEEDGKDDEDKMTSADEEPEPGMDEWEQKLCSGPLYMLYLK